LFAVLSPILGHHLTLPIGTLNRRQLCKTVKHVFEQLDIFNDYFKEIIEESMYDKLKQVCRIPEGEEIIVADIEFLARISAELNGCKDI
jgi:dephospho-CoA kinase